MTKEHNLKTQLRLLVWEQVINDKRTYREIATEAEVTLTVVHQLVYNKKISIESIMKIGEVYGVRLEIVCDERKEPEESEPIKSGVVNSFKSW